MFVLRPVDRLKFFLERQFLKGAHYQFLAMAAVIVLISILGGFLVLGTEPDQGLGESVWWAFLRLSDPGYLGDDEGLRRRAVSTVLTMSGYVLVLGTVVAILTRWLISFMRRLERGLTPVAMSDHIVVLGWTDRTIPIIAEVLLSAARGASFFSRAGRKRRARLAVLADDLTPELVHELRSEKSIGRKAHHVVMRSGSSLDVRHLQRVASLQAAAVVVPTQVFDIENLITSDVETVKTLLTLDGLAEQAGQPLPYVVAELQDIRKVPVAKRAYGGPLELIAGNTVISRLIVQNLHHPGLSRVYNDLLSSESGAKFIIQADERFAESTFDEARRSFTNEILIGVVRQEKGRFVPHLVPPGDFPLRSEDRLVYIADVAAHPAPKKMSPPNLAEATQVQTSEGSESRASGPRSILILGWSTKVLALLSELATYRSEKVEVCVVSTVAAEERERQVTEYGISSTEITCAQKEADFTIRANLRALEPERFDHVIFLSSDRLSTGGEADARTIVGYLTLQEVLRDVEAPPHILMELAEANNRRLMGDRVGEVIISPLLLSHVLAQVAICRELRPVLEELFTAQGAEIHFRTPRDYGIAEGEQTFASMQRQLWSQGEILLGVGDELNPPAATIYEVRSMDSLIVIGRSQS